MSKKIRTIVIGAVVLLVLAAAVAVLMLLPEKEEDSSSILTPTTSSVSIADQSSEQVRSISVKNREDAYTIELAGENLWRIQELGDFPANQSQYNTTRIQVSTLTAIQVVEEHSTRLGDYGLQPAEAEIRVEFQDGTSYEVALGNISPDGLRRYARRLDTETDTVYGLSTTALSAAYLPRTAYLDTQVTPAFASETGAGIELNLLSITGNYMESPIVIQEIEDDDPDKERAMDSVKMTSPVRSLVDSMWMQNNVYSFFSLTADEVVAVSPTDLSVYGLDPAYMTAEMRYEETSSFRLLVGSGIDSEGNPAANPKDIASYYVMREGVDLVYAVPKENLPWVGVKPSQVITSLVILPNIASVDRVELELEGKKHTLQITQTPNPEEPDDPQKNDFTFTMDGAATDEDMSRKFYQLLLSTGIQDVNLTERELSSPSMSITYHMLDGTSDRIDFYVLEDLTTIVSLNGNNAYIGRSGLVDKVGKELSNLLSGEAVETDW
ncbi:MAG: DUF4340 domain-containing protein [Oscillospiraceae bacterium]|jgi:hypothetical protein|nr:DUF4340 domain-containing protein [Oscillospiraceae bacterium]